MQQKDLRCYAVVDSEGTRCSRPAFSRGFCYTHYRRLHRGADPNTPIREKSPDGAKRMVLLPKVQITAAAFDDFVTAAGEEGLSAYAMLQKIVHDWHAERIRRGEYAPPSAGVVEAG